MNTTTLALGAHESATTELVHAHAAVSGAVGLIALLLGWAGHHAFAHRHQIADLLSKALISTGAVIMFAGPSSTTVTWLNHFSQPFLAWLMRIAKVSPTWPATFGLFTAIEILLLILFVADVWDTIKRRGGRGGGGGSGKFLTQAWEKVKFYYDKYGIFAVGPLTLTLPGSLGFVAAFPFALLASAIGGLIHTGTGW